MHVVFAVNNPAVVRRYAELKASQEYVFREHGNRFDALPRKAEKFDDGGRPDRHVQQVDSVFGDLPAGLASLGKDLFLFAAVDRDAPNARVGGSFV